MWMVDEGLRKDVQVGIPELVNKYAGMELLEYAKWLGCDGMLIYML